MNQEDLSYKRVLLSHKKNKILLFATAWMDLENIMLGEMSDKDKLSPVCEI